MEKISRKNWLSTYCGKNKIALKTTTGKIITRFGADVMVKIETGETLRCTAKRKFEQITCGDHVTIEYQPHGNARVIRLAKRHNVLTRPDFRGRLRNIAANIDQVVIVLSWLPEPFWGLVDRYIIAATLLKTDIILVVNKSDLAAQYATEKAITCLAEYRRIGYTVIETSANTDSSDKDSHAELVTLQQALNNHTSILVGQSGVGKSSIAIRLLSETTIRIGAISNSGEGQHTTTTSSLYDIPSGGFLIDSPGVRDYKLPADISEQTLRNGYPEFADYAQQCRFNNCTHQHEPQCKVRSAYEDNTIPPKRYQRYLYLLGALRSGTM